MTQVLHCPSWDCYPEDMGMIRAWLDWSTFCHSPTFLTLKVWVTWTDLWLEARSWGWPGGSQNFASTPNCHKAVSHLSLVPKADFQQTQLLKSFVQSWARGKDGVVRASSQHWHGMSPLGYQLWAGQQLPTVASVSPAFPSVQHEFGLLASTQPLYATSGNFVTFETSIPLSNLVETSELAQIHLGEGAGQIHRQCDHAASFPQKTRL